MGNLPTQPEVPDPGGRSTAEIGQTVTVAEGTLDALRAAVVEAERHVAGFGWDQPPRLFALVRTLDLLAREPGLAPT